GKGRAALRQEPGCDAHWRAAGDVLPGACAEEEVVPVLKRFSYQNHRFSSSNAAPTTQASGSGRSYQVFPSSLGISVSPYTKPCNSESGRGLVIALTARVTRRQAIQAKMAIQKFCAIVDGNL